MVPNFFSKAKIPDSLPKGMQDVVDKLKRSKCKKDCLKRAYDILSKKYKGGHIFTRFFDLFETKIDKIWSKKGDSHCTNLNYLLRVLLVKSGFFKDKDIKLKRTLIYISPHQYLRVRVSKNGFVNVDIWGAYYGIMFGDYARSFNYRLF